MAKTKKQLEAENRELREENRQLREENRELRELVAELRKRIQDLEAEVKQLKKRRFAPKSERNRTNAEALSTWFGMCPANGGGGGLPVPQNGFGQNAPDMKKQRVDLSRFYAWMCVWLTTHTSNE